MEAPDLQLLKCGDKATWDNAFKWLWPTAFAVAKNKLHYRWPEGVEDIAIESITKLIQYFSKAGDKVGKVEELRAILSKITHDECIGFIRKNLTIKHGGGNIQSLEGILKATGDQIVEDHESDWTAHQRHAGSMDSVSSDLVRLIMGLTDQLKPRERLVFEEFHINRLSYEEIAIKHGFPKQQIGVYLKRALETLRKLLKKKNEDYL